MKKNYLKVNIVTLTIILFLAGLLPALYISIPQPNPSGNSQQNSPKKYSRIICTSPALCSIVYALGLGPKIVGLGDECTYPESTNKVKKVGKWGGVSLEALASLTPDLLITQGLPSSLHSFCNTHKMSVIDLNIQSIDDLYSAVNTIAATTGMQNKSDILIRKIQHELDAIHNKSSKSTPPEVLLTLARTPGSLARILVPGKDTFLSQLLNIAGGKNVFSDAIGLWPQISSESILVRSPDLIIELVPDESDPEYIKRMRNDWQQVPNLTAVKDNRIYYICSERILIPGFDIAETAKDLYAILTTDREFHE